MPASPLEDAEGTVRVTVTSEGAPVNADFQIISLQVRRAINKVPSATLVIADGDMPAQEFPASDSATFKPGAAVVISAGYGDDERAIFSGIVVRHSLKIAGENDARLIVECRDKAVKMTVGRKSGFYEDKKDSDVMRTLIGNHGLSAEVTATTVQHKSLIQHYCSDWDYLLARAEAVGAIVLVKDGTVGVAPPQTSGEAVLAVAYGDSLIDFQAELDARHQFTAVQAQGWDMSTQALLQSSDAAPATLNQQGDIDSATLAQVLGLGTYTLQTGAPWAKDALDDWAKAQQLKSGLARLRGRMSFQGSALAEVGSLIDVKGVGKRFDGAVFASGLTHRIAEGAWTTEIEFGTPSDWFTAGPDVIAPPASGLVPGIEGLHVGVVLKLDADPAGEQRVQVSVPSASIAQVWARLLQFHASNAFGAFFLPEVGDEVLLGWFNNDPGFPVVLGSLYSSNHTPPYALAAENKIKAIVTRCLAKLEFNDEDKVITLQTPAGNKIVISDKDKSILVTDQNSNKIELNTSGITLDSPKDINISAKGAITISAVGALSMSSKADAKLDGLNVACTAQVGMTAKGSASAELSAAGQTTVKGAMVMIN